MTVSNSIESYNKVINEINNIYKTNNNFSLKEFKQGILNCNSMILSRNDLNKKIKEFSHDQGWFMYTDEIKLANNDEFDSSKRLLEAELSKKDNLNNGEKLYETIKIKHIIDDTYSYIEYKSTVSPNDTSEFAYYDIDVIMRQDFSKYKRKIKYRLWFKLDKENSKWDSYAQQFLKFTKDGDK